MDMRHLRPEYRGAGSKIGLCFSILEDSISDDLNYQALKRTLENTLDTLQVYGDGLIEDDEIREDIINRTESLKSTVEAILDNGEDVDESALRASASDLNEDYHSHASY